VAVFSTLQDDLFEESTADVSAAFKAVNILLTELDVLGRFGSQTFKCA